MRSMLRDIGPALLGATRGAGSFVGGVYAIRGMLTLAGGNPWCILCPGSGIPPMFPLNRIGSFVTGRGGCLLSCTGNAGLAVYIFLGGRSA